MNLTINLARGWWWGSGGSFIDGHTFYLLCQNHAQMPLKLLSQEKANDESIYMYAPKLTTIGDIQQFHVRCEDLPHCRLFPLQYVLLKFTCISL